MHISNTEVHKDYVQSKHEHEILHLSKSVKSGVHE